MNRTLIGIPTFGNWRFTELAIQGLARAKAAAECSYDLFAVVGKPDDRETIDGLTRYGIPFSRHPVNLGLPAALNDIYDRFAAGYDNIIVMANDVIPYRGAIDRMIALADQGEWDLVSASELDVKTLCGLFPEARAHFTGDSYNYDFTGKPWTLAEGRVAAAPNATIPNVIMDVHNLCLYRRSAFEKVGYVDCSFFPAYFEDNDYGRRMLNAGIKSCHMTGAVYFHFWSRTIHQGSGGSTDDAFHNNESFYRTKWGGPVGREKWTLPFNGRPYRLCDGIVLAGSLKIDTRRDEAAIAAYWRNKHIGVLTRARLACASARARLAGVKAGRTP
jgi:GT2 family glycosyltransferase